MDYNCGHRISWFFEQTIHVPDRSADYQRKWNWLPTSDPVDLFSFAITTVGLLWIALYGATFAKNSARIKQWSQVDLKKISYIITFFGLYFIATYLMWLIFGTPSGWSVWHPFFFNLNMDLWCISFFSVASAGKVMVASDGKVTLEVPANALIDKTNITINPTQDSKFGMKVKSTDGDTREMTLKLT